MGIAKLEIEALAGYGQRKIGNRGIGVGAICTWERKINSF